MKNKIFISYSRKDDYFARCLAADLEACGAEIWIDVDDIPVGAKWSTAVQEGLRHSQVMLLLMSPEAMDSPNVEDEWNYFHDKKKTIIPILWRDCEPHFQLWRMPRVDFRREHVEYRAGLRSLLDVLAMQGMRLAPPAGLLEATGQTRPRKSVIIAAQSSDPITQPSRRGQSLIMPAQAPAPAPTVIQNHHVHNRGAAFILGSAIILAALIVGLALVVASTLFNKEHTEAADLKVEASPVVPSAATLQLIYDNEILTLRNISEVDQDVHRLRFQSVDNQELVFVAEDWQKGAYRGMGSIYALPPGGCFQLGINVDSATDMLADCKQLHLWAAVFDAAQLFWQPEASKSFTVLMGGRELAQCSVSGGVCEFSLARADAQ
jgi:hypothetical protein